MYSVEQGICITSFHSVSWSGQGCAEVGLFSLWLSVSPGASVGDILLAPAYPIRKVTLWEGLLYLASASEIDKLVAKGKVFARTRNKTRGPVTRPSTLSTKLSLHPSVPCWQLRKSLSWGTVVLWLLLFSLYQNRVHYLIVSNQSCIF